MGIALQRVRDIVEPLLPDRGAGLAELDRPAALSSARAVRLQGEVLGMGFVKAVPPVAERMARVERKGVQLQPLKASPLIAAGGLLQRVEHEEEMPTAELRVVAVLERRQGDRCARLDVLPQLARPEPAHAQVVLQKGVDRVDRAIFLLDAHDLAAPAVRGRHVRRIPAVAPGDHQVPIVGRDQDLLRMLEIEIHAGKQRVQCRLAPHPDRGLRQRIGQPLQHLGPRAADLLDIHGQLVRRLARERRRVLEHHNGHPRSAAFDQDQLRNRRQGAQRRKHQCLN